MSDEFGSQDAEIKRELEDKTRQFDADYASLKDTLLVKGSNTISESVIYLQDFFYKKLIDLNNLAARVNHYYLPKDEQTDREKAAADNNALINDRVNKYLNKGGRKYKKSSKRASRKSRKHRKKTHRRR